MSIFPYLLWKFGKERRKERWMIVIDKPYHDTCWWYESVNLSRRFVIIVLAALPLDHKVKLILLTISIIFLKAVHLWLQPFASEHLNVAENMFLTVLIIICVVSASSAKGMDGFVLILALFPAIYTICFTLWLRCRRRQNSDEGLIDSTTRSTRLWQGMNPLNNLMNTNQSREEGREIAGKARRDSNIELASS